MSNLKKNLEICKCPFAVDGKIEFPVDVQNAFLAVWTLTDEEVDNIYGRKPSILAFPDSMKKARDTNFGLVLAKGDGTFVWSKERNDWIWLSMDDLEVGDIVWYDRSVPIRMKIKDPKGEFHSLITMGRHDVRCVVEV